jgi:hypothetical protein
LRRRLPLPFDLRHSEEVLPAEQHRDGKRDGEEEVLVVFTHERIRDLRRR